MATLPPFIIDCGPALNFLCSGYERLLTAAIGGQPLHAPKTVEDEVYNNDDNFQAMPRKKKFKGARGKWNKMKPNWLKILSDDTSDPALLQAATALGLGNLTTVQAKRNDLGETMVVIHAYAQASAGRDVAVIIDDAKGRELAFKARDIAIANQLAGRIFITSTVNLVKQRLNTPDIPDLATLEVVWDAIARMDTGLWNNYDNHLNALQKAAGW